MMNTKMIKENMETTEFKEENWYCYVLKSIKKPRTYCGITNNLKNRKDQHNKIKKGGAKSTASGGPWEFYIIIKGFKSRSEVSSFEWLMKHPTREKKRPKEYTGEDGRVKSLNLILGLDRWSDKTEGLQKAIEEGRQYFVYVDPKYSKILDKRKMKTNIVIKDISELKY